MRAVAGAQLLSYKIEDGLLQHGRQLGGSGDLALGAGLAALQQLADGAQAGTIAQPLAQGAHGDGLAFSRQRFHCRIDLFRAYFCHVVHS